MEILILIWAIWPIMTATIAYSKNRSWFGWGVMGILIGLFGVVWIACLPKLEQ